MEIFFSIIEILGVIAFSVSGAITAIDKETDLFGVVFLSVVTSFGGGILRDVMIGTGIPLIFENYLLIIVCVITSLAVFAMAAIFKQRFIENEELVSNINNYFDAAGLGVFAVSGCKVCMDLGIENPVTIIVMGMITCIGGGMIRDFSLREIPFVLRKRVYAFAALLGSGVYWGLSVLDVNEIVSMMAGFATVVIIRVCATVFKWNFPKAIEYSKLKEKEAEAGGAEALAAIGEQTK